MTTPLWVLLAFAVWTMIVLTVGVGLHRWSLILSGRAQLTDFPGDTAHGTTTYRRIVRAHANCVENLPVFGAIVLTAFAGHVTSPTLDLAAIIFLVARICQTLVHALFVEANTTVFIRFSFFAVQLVIMLWMAVEVARHAAA